MAAFFESRLYVSYLDIRSLDGSFFPRRHLVPPALLVQNICYQCLFVMSFGFLLVRSIAGYRHKENWRRHRHPVIGSFSPLAEGKMTE